MTPREIKKLSANERVAILSKDFIDRDQDTFVRVKSKLNISWSPNTCQNSPLSRFLCGEKLQDADLLKNAYESASNLLMAMNIPKRVKIIINERGDMSATDHKRLWVATDYFDDKRYTPEQKMDIFRGLTIHEGGHLLWTVRKDSPNTTNRLLHDIWNVIEDEMQERRTGATLGALAYFLAPVKKHYYGNYEKEATKTINSMVDPALRETADIFNTLLAMIRYPASLDAELLKKHSAFLLDVRDNVLTPFPVSTAESTAAAKKIYEMLRQYIKEQVGKDLAEQQQGKSSQGKKGQKGGDGETISVTVSVKASGDEEDEQDGNSSAPSAGKGSDGTEQSQYGDGETGQDKSSGAGNDDEGGEKDTDNGSSSKGDSENGDSDDENKEEGQDGQGNEGSDDSDAGNQKGQEGAEGAQGDEDDDEDGDEDEGESPTLTDEEAQKLLDEVQDALEDALKSLSAQDDSEEDPKEKARQQAKQQSKIASDQILSALIHGDLSVGTTSLINQKVDNDPLSIKAYRSSRKAMQPYITPIRNELRNLGRDIVLKTRGWRSGLLDTDHKLVDAHVGVQNVYTRTSISKADRMAVCLLVDESGSMDSREKDGRYSYVWARDTAVLISEALTGLDNVDVFIYGFGYFFRIYQEGGNRPSTKLGAIYANGSTPTAEGMTEAFARIRKRTAEKILMFVVTDGGANDSGKVVNVCNSLSKKGVTPVGIGVGTDCVKDTFKNNLVLSDFRQLPKALGKVIRDAVKDASGGPRQTL
jgi:hypothetical protein